MAEVYLTKEAYKELEEKIPALYTQWEELEQSLE